MNYQEALLTAEDLLKPWTVVVSRPEEYRKDMVVSISNLYSAVAALVDAHWGYLSAITALDHPGSSRSSSEDKRWERSDLSETAVSSINQEGIIEVLYHFCEGPAILTLRVRTSRAVPSVPSICQIIPTATLYERELIEMFGIEVIGTPNTDRLLLADDWPRGVYPLRKDFHGLS